MTWCFIALRMQLARIYAEFGLCRGIGVDCGAAFKDTQNCAVKIPDLQED